MIKRSYLLFLVALISLLISSSTTMHEQQTIYLFSHGIADTYRQAFNYLQDKTQPNKPYLIQTNLITFDYPDATTGYLRVNRHETSLAQDHEIIHLANRFYRNINANDQVVLIGVSRGASSLINFMSWYKPTSVQALILESPFDSADSIIRNIVNLAGLAWIPGSQCAGLALLCSIFKKYNSKGLKPVESVKNIPVQLPILLICSLQDSLVPAWSTIILYSALVATGNKHVYLLILPQGAHGRLISHPLSGQLYQTTAHAFYRRYGLPHNPILAEQGEYLLNDAQPGVSELACYMPAFALPAGQLPR